ncbi:FPC/CPF motif-containing protein YcgG [Metabacillus crassostreae]|uniref:YqcI/YcgG family protein n=1 Tax=Metabacillus crassostreae TaxID=929098 RepID=UPI00195E4D90|nr:YqcI/YcgG family protein [Metabacillus crassostreae]MBM7602949.1 FPC/CPF motif-containing protein YcgG [Metabacillus crassostreae]
MNLLFSKTDLDSANFTANDWRRLSYHAFSEKLSNKDTPFPCVPATHGFSTNQLRYGFVSDPRKKEAITELAELLKEYGENSRSYGPYTSLIILFETPEDIIENNTVEEFEELYWNILTNVSELDQSEWPENIPFDPGHHLWEYCFEGEQYFMYCATPKHVNRQSRSFPTLMFAITPRWVLDTFNAKPKRADKTKEIIRKRLGNYDSVDIHPDLKGYGEDDNFEWRQYFIRDDDKSLSKCPFLNKLKKNDKKA